MAKSKKYDFRIKQDNTCWSAEIIRKATAKKIIVSKRQKGFTTESEAQEWAQNELKTFLAGLHERNKHHRTIQHESDSVRNTTAN